MTPDDIDTRSSRALEWERLKECLAREAQSAWARELCLELAPEAERLLVENLLQETKEAFSLLEERTIYRFEGLPDIRETLRRLSAAAVLSGAELHELKIVLLMSRQCRKTLSVLEKDSFPALSRCGASLVGIPDLFDAIDNAVEKNGELRDEASEKLAGLRLQVQNIDGTIRSKLNSLIQSLSAARALQEPFFTQRNNRYVLPVLAGLRKSVQGIVHDSSASGLTVYIEPIEIVELTNKLSLKYSEIEREIQAILTQLSRLAYQNHDQISTTYGIMVALDVIYAKAAFAQKYGGICPRINDDGSMHLIKARHPLLCLQNLSAGNKEAPPVVPNDILIGGEFDTLIVTGPNTGGKTVFLKTAGLLSLMARAGLLIPAAPGSSIAVYAKVYADIGDEQSIEQSLSTFSSHMTNLVSITENADSHSLVLLDEIGAGTDPREGAAIASAILQHLHAAGARTLSTTHFSELKVLAYSRAGFMNASFEFDDEKLQPTYNLKLGVPGSSKGTTIASRLGLDSRIVGTACNLLQSDETNLEKTVEKLEMKIAEMAIKQAEAEHASLAAAKMEAEAAARLARLKESGESLRQEVACRMENEFHQAKQALNELIARLQKEPKLADVQKAKEQMDAIRRDLAWLEAEGAAEPVTDLCVGKQVLVRSLNQIAVVEELPEYAEKEPGTVVPVRIGSMRVRVPISDLKSAPAPANVGKKGRQRPLKQGKPGKSPVKAERTHAPFLRTDLNALDIRGKRVDEAMAEVESFIDRAMVRASGPVMIIHGHGTGALKAAVRDYLSGSAYALVFRAGEQNEGGQGVTIVDVD